MSDALREVFSDPPPFEDGGSGGRNAAALEAARVRPAIFDMSCLIYRMIYAKADDYARLSKGDDGRIAHAVAADVMCDVADACRHFACGPVCAFDSGRSYRTEQVYAGYKDASVRGQQKKTPNQERTLSCKGEAVRLLRRVYCPSYGVQSFCVHGYESDDIMAALVLGLKQRGLLEEPAYARPVVMVTSDHDLYQVVLEGVFVADVATGVLCKAEDIERHTKIAVSDVVAAKCVGGCKSDVIPGVPGCGEKTTAEVLLKRGTDLTGPNTGKGKRALESEAGAAILRRNLRLIRLPFVGEPAMPQILLSSKRWPKPGVPEDMAALMEANGVPQARWPSFADVTLPRAAGAVPVCAYKKKEVTD